MKDWPRLWKTLLLAVINGVNVRGEKTAKLSGVWGAGAHVRLPWAGGKLPRKPQTPDSQEHLCVELPHLMDPGFYLLCEGVRHQS